jgi:RalA-binding protein 1
MDDSSTDEQEFPGLYTEKGKKTEENESNSSENFDVKRKEKNKKEKIDRQYETLGADSDEDAGSRLFRSPSKSKKSSKTFKFTSGKKLRTEKSKERELELKDTPDGKDKKDKKEKKEKEHKEKDKKEKKKEKEKSKGIANEGSEAVEMYFHVFGISLGLAVERSKCHDGVKLPLVVRNCIDYLQDNLNSDQIYKVEGVKTRIQNLKKCYNNREPITEEMDVATASTLLKTYISELPEPILTTELTARFEEVSALPEVTTQAKEFAMLIDQLPKVNQVLLAWLSRHLSAVINHGKSNKMNAQSLAVLLSPILQMSHRLLITLLCHADLLFADVHLEK